MPFQSDFLTMEIDETVHQPHTGWFNNKYQSDTYYGVESQTRYDFYSSKSRWASSSIPSSPASSNSNRNFFKRKEEAHLEAFYRTNDAQKPMKEQGYYSTSLSNGSVYSGNFHRTNYETPMKDPGYSSGSSTGSITPPNSPLDKSFMRMGLENTPRKEKICIGLKPSERINYYRETLPLHNQPGYIPHSQWELMAPPKTPLRRPNSLPSYLI